jgi:hypothetical protein
MRARCPPPAAAWSPRALPGRPIAMAIAFALRLVPVPFVTALAAAACHGRD